MPLRFFQRPLTSMYSTTSATQSFPSFFPPLDRDEDICEPFSLSLSRRPKEGKPKEKRNGETVCGTTVWPLLQPRGQPRGDSLFTECKSGFIWWLCVHRPRRGFLRSRSLRMDPPFTSVAERRPLLCRPSEQPSRNRVYIHIYIFVIYVYIYIHV